MSTDGAALDRYPALDALRGTAAFAVMFYHLRDFNSSGELQVFSSGYLAVDLFFVLSGFVICHAYEARLQSDLTLRDFMILRFIRLQPVMMMGTLIGFILAVCQRAMGLQGAPGFAEIASSFPVNLLMLPNIFVPWGIFLFNPPAWSLFYELLANAWYALATRCRAGRLAPQGPGKALILLCLVGYLGVVISVLLEGSLDRGVVLQDWPIAVSRIGFSFALGIVLCRSKLLWRARLPKIPVHWLLLGCLGLLSPFPFGAWRMAYDLMFVTVASPLLVMLGTSATIPSRLKGCVVGLGLLSYPLYAVHAPIKHMIEASIPAGADFLWIASACAAVGVAWPLAMIDPALRRWLTSRLRGARSADRHGLQRARSTAGNS
ncbi:acyltransferase family protein [Novosphingobium kaempferiae]|uniref:acyltransferase family protein n=1 Tax=Novosphingobium kaempferiae TaxID=2896849 RepID=UPI001E501FA4|nr:acyltransferase [Novosphingobium kaempferiae]